MLVYDAFTFFNEWELLKIRLDHLKDECDLHILIEGDRTFRREHKPLHFEEEWEYYITHEQREKIMLVSAFMGGNGTASPWEMEYAQRDALEQAIPMLDSEGALFLSDVDEIPSKLREAAKYLADGSCDRIEYTSDCYYYAFNLRAQDQSGTIKGQLVKNFKGGQDLRRHSETERIIDATHNLGFKSWHYSYCMSPELIQTKIKSFAHSELDISKYTDIDKVESRIKNHMDPFDRWDLVKEDIETLEAPKYILDRLDYYKQLNLII